MGCCELYAGDDEDQRGAEASTGYTGVDAGSQVVLWLDGGESDDATCEDEEACE
jgi:hypothetical protein